MSGALVERPEPSPEELFKEAIASYFWRLLVDQGVDREPKIGLSHNDLVQYASEFTPEELRRILPKKFREMLTDDCAGMTQAQIIEHIEDVTTDLVSHCMASASSEENIARLRAMGLHAEADSVENGLIVISIGSTATQDINVLDVELLKTA